MRIETISAHYGRKFNLDNWESVELGATLWAKLEEGDPDVLTCLGELFAAAKQEIQAQATPTLARRDARRRSKAARVLKGLPKDLRELAEAALQTEFNDMPPDGGAGGSTATTLTGDVGDRKAVARGKE